MIKLLPISLLSCFSLFACSDLRNDQRNSNSAIDSPVFTQMTCVFFFIPDCPASKLDMAEMVKLHKKYSNSGLKISAILSDPAPNDSILQRSIKDYRFEIPIKFDSTLALAKLYGATTTPQVFLFDKDSMVVYNGQVTNYYYQYGRHKTKATKYYLEDAIVSLINNQAVEVKTTTPIGCKINFD